IGDATFEAAGAIGEAAKAVGSFVIRDFVLDVAAAGGGNGNAVANLYGFDGLDAHERLRQAAIEFLVPLRVAAEPGGNIVRDNFEYAADGVVGRESRVHFGFHFFLNGGVRAAQRRIQIRTDGANFLPRSWALKSNVAHLNGVTGDFRAEFFQQDFGEGASRDARGGLPGG